MVYRVQIEILEQSLKKEQTNRQHRLIFGLCSCCPHLELGEHQEKHGKKPERFKNNASLQR